MTVAPFAGLVLCLGCPAQEASASTSATAQLDALVTAAMRSGHLPSIAVGIVRGPELVYTRVLGLADQQSGRKATAKTLYRICSLSKLFTATLLVQLRDEGVLRLDDPVRVHLGRNWKLPTDPRGAAAITFRHLAQHASGLPERPVDVPTGERYFWGDYDSERLRRSLAKTELVGPIGDTVLYSNLGFGLLGHALSCVSKTSYADLVHARLLRPLGMKNSAVSTAAALGERLARGYHPGPDGSPAKPWELGCLEGCGGIASNIPDMARFLSLQFRAGRAGVSPVSGGSLAELHRPQRILDGWRQAIGLGWIIDRTDDLGDVVRHNGAMAGYRSHIGFSPTEQVGVIVLTNSGHTPKRNVVSALGGKLLRRAIPAFVRPAPPMRELVARMLRQFRPQPEEDVFELFVPSFLERIPRTAIRSAFADPAKKHGKCLRRISLKAIGSRWRVQTVLEFADGHREKCVLHASPRPPHGLTYLTIGQ